GLFLHGRVLSPRDLGWLATLLLASYVLATSALGSTVPRLETVWQALRLPERVHRWPGAWFALTQCLLGGCVLGLGVGVALDFPRTADRLLGPFTGLLLVAACLLLTDASPTHWHRGLRYAALSLAALLPAETGWAVLAPAHPAVWLHRTVLLLLALVLATAAYGFAADRLLPRRSAWVEAARPPAPRLGVLALLVLLPIFGQEFLAFVPAQARTPMAEWAVWSVLVALLVMIASAIGFAVSAAPDPLGLPAVRRTLYVYLAEVLLVLFVVHLRLNVPCIFPP